MVCFDRELLRLVPRVLRARDFHLYIEGGKRLTDLWRQGGKALLGHKRPRVVGELKNAAERGLFCALPHPLEKRFLKALAGLFPDRAFRLFLNEGSMHRALGKAGVSGNVPLWRPFLEKVTVTFFTPVLPWSLGPEVLVLEKSLDASFPPGDLIPPVLLAAAARALYDLAAVLKENKIPRYPKIEKALSQSHGSGTGGASSGGSGVWRRQGIYLTTELNKTNYAELFKKFLEGGFLIPPSSEEPAILPFTMSQGEEAKLAELIQS